MTLNSDTSDSSDNPTDTNDAELRTRYFKISDFSEIWSAMKELTELRDQHSADEFWFLQHSPVYTLGLNGKDKHLISPSNIPLVKTDRGGQVTYHGPGQLIVYTLFDIERRNMSIKDFVHKLEQAIINLLAEYDITAKRREGAPGVYVDEAKIGALGLRVKKGKTYHGLSLNVDMDLSPFNNINPCGYSGLKVTQLSDFVPNITMAEVQDKLHTHLCLQLGYNAAQSIHT